jgi:hypothetical protein
MPDIHRLHRYHSPAYEKAPPGRAESSVITWPALFSLSLIPGSIFFTCLTLEAGDLAAVHRKHVLADQPFRVLYTSAGDLPAADEVA